jgi:hypothetical protein
MNIDMLEEIRARLISELTGGDETISQTPVAFSIKVEELAATEKLTLIEALSVLVETFNLDTDQVPKMITSGLKQKIAIEAGIGKPRKSLEM